MASTNQRSQAYHAIKPLTYHTPLLDGESMTSWLVRASLNQGCNPVVLIHCYWQPYKLWNNDFDKGFDMVAKHIHHDMAVLAKSPVKKFNQQTTLTFAKQTDGYTANQRVKWVQPITRASGRRSASGFRYCPICMNNDSTAHLQLAWRFSWVLYCDKHQMRLQNTCMNCGKVYQPQLLSAKHRYINRCHCCNNRISDVHTLVESREFDTATAPSYQLQLLAKSVVETGSGLMFGVEVSTKDWFEALDFVISLLRRSTLANNTTYEKLVQHLFAEIDTDNMPLTSPKTGLSFDYLSDEDRLMLLHYAHFLVGTPVLAWVNACQVLGLTKNTFDAIACDSKRIPLAFQAVYDDLPIFNLNRGLKTAKDFKPKTAINVLRSWQRLQRKMQQEDEVA